MSKLAGYSDEDKTLIITLMQIFVNAKMKRRELHKDEAAARTEMPKAFDASKGYVDTVNTELSGYGNYDPADLTRIRAITAQLFVGAIQSGEITYDMELDAVIAFTKKRLRDGIQAVNAVNEYICG